MCSKIHRACRVRKEDSSEENAIFFDSKWMLFEERWETELTGEPLYEQGQMRRVPWIAKMVRFIITNRLLRIL